MNRPERIALVVYVRRTYITLDFCKLSIRRPLFCNMQYVIYIKESVEAVMIVNYILPNRNRFKFDIAAIDIFYLFLLTSITYQKF